MLVVEVAYQVLPILGISPYLDVRRYENPKEIFKFTAGALEGERGSDPEGSLLDVACANGELIYYLKRRFPKLRFTGIDYCEDYIRVAKQAPGLSGVSFEAVDMFAFGRTFDVVTFHGTMPSFKDFRRPLERLLRLVNPGGVLLLSGYFNPFHIDARIEFCDRSKPQVDGIWRSDYNLHSQKSVAEFLQGRCRSFTFEEIPMGVDLPRDEAKPHLDSFTFKDESGKRLITSGLCMILTDYHLTIRK